MRRPALLVIVAALLVAAGWRLTPPGLGDPAPAATVPDDIDAWLASIERAVDAEFGLIAGAEKRVRWQVPGQRTRTAIVYLHGFSATRQEIAPTSALVADRLGANLYETRLSGHGHDRSPMHGVRAEDWLRDGVEALAIGAAIGERMIVIGTSTGATLALALIGHPSMERVRTLVLISPNIEPGDPTAKWLTWPAGPVLARLVAGDTRSWTPHNDLQRRYWSTSYPTAAVVEVMRLVDRAKSLASVPMTQEVLMLLSPQDTVISPAAARRAYDSIDAPRKALVEILDAGDPSHHVLAGDILSPGTTEEIADLIADFVLGRD